MEKLFRSVLASALLIATVGAQNAAQTLPRVFSQQYAPLANQLPLGRTKAFVQYWYRGDNLLSGQSVQSIGWRVDENTVIGSTPITIEVVLDNSPATFANLDRTFANNLSQAPVTFFSMKTVSLPAQAKPSNPDAPAAWLPGDVPFAFVGPNLIVQCDVQTSIVAASTGYDVDAYAMSTAVTELHGQGGPSCAGSTLTASFDRSTATYALTLRRAPANSPVMLMFGTRNTVLSSTGDQLPLDLGSIGMPGCRLGVDPDLFLPAMADAGGSLVAPLVTGWTSSMMLFAQVAHPTTGNPMGLATTNVATSVLGYQGLNTYLYNWTSFGPTAEFGPFDSNRGPVLLIR